MGLPKKVWQYGSPVLTQSDYNEKTKSLNNIHRPCTYELLFNYNMPKQQVVRDVMCKVSEKQQVLIHPTHQAKRSAAGKIDQTHKGFKG